MFKKYSFDMLVYAIQDITEALKCAIELDDKHAIKKYNTQLTLAFKEKNKHDYKRWVESNKPLF